MAETAHDLYEAGDLEGAIALLTGELKSRPTDVDKRGLLTELLCFAGDLERADLQLDTMSRQEPEASVGAALFRQLLRAEQARRHWYTEGRVPTFVDQPTQYMRLLMEASVAWREGAAEDAARLAAEAEAEREHASGRMGTTSFDDFRDLDDLLGGVLEVLTSNGQYYWVAMARVIQLEFAPPQRPRDLLWRRAHIMVADGPEGEVFIPALYVPPPAMEVDARTRLGRTTEWSGETPPVRGVGQRMFLAGTEAVAVMQLETLEFDRSPGETAGWDGSER